jgi:hypothetical protein
MKAPSFQTGKAPIDLPCFEITSAKKGRPSVQRGCTRSWHVACYDWDVGISAPDHGNTNATCDHPCAFELARSRRTSGVASGFALGRRLTCWYPVNPGLFHHRSSRRP